MWDGSAALLRRAQSDAIGSDWVRMSALLLTAFTFESYLNHIGPKLFKSWKVLESLGPLEKLEVVCERLKLSFPRGERPAQSIVTLFKFRNALAHGKNETLEASVIRDNTEGLDVFLGEPLKARWEKQISHANVERVRGDVEKIIRKLHGVADPEGDSVFSPGLTGGYSKII